MKRVAETIKELFSFKGEVNRNKFLLFVIPILIVYSILAMDDSIRSVLLLIPKFLIMLLLAIIYLSFLVKRLSNLQKPIWLIVIPGYNIYLFILMFFVKGPKKK